ncbi:MULTISPECIES: hypothetical protein [Acinetobacter]|uniref:hypothetical protein n=1 Tax=Acinetobacter TaxID=469 RepID=UPI001D0D83AF|nr:MULTISPECIES: hypothetical protein [Acinetobacter]WLF72382.1 hypothetical protein Q4617_15560 [Acinetobacter junii]
MALSIQAFLEPISSTFSYVIADTENKKCAVIDSVLDYEINSARTSTSHADEIIEYIQDHQYHLEWIEPYRVCRRVNILRDYPDDKIKIYP